VAHFQEYEHTQPGTLIRLSIGGGAVALGILAIVLSATGAVEGAIICAVMAVVFVFLLCLFHSLAVRVSRDDVAIAFGIGVVRKSFIVDDIQSVSGVRNHWYNGWGIRKIRGGWLYNVSGWDAVQIDLTDGRKYRIGTDEPRELLMAIESAVASAG
jgi:hypothetical protein